jgi:predicted transposase/invertase (TIGR01784 family)
MRFVNPKNDVAFKKIFGDENRKEILISFLNAVLNLQGMHEIADLTILNPYQAPKLAELKYTLLDVRAIDKRGVTFIVEMQVEQVAGYQKRFLYYGAKAYAGQIERGDDYPKLNQVIFIGILDFIGFEGAEYLSRHLILNQATHKQEIDGMEFNFIELPKFTKQEHELTTLLDKWVYFLKYASDLDVIPDSADTTSLKAAYEVAERFRWSKDELEIYDYWGMKAQDERGIAIAAEERGERRGEQRGKEIGKEIGRRETQLATARALLTDGVDRALAAKYSGLSEAELEELLGVGG